MDSEPTWYWHWNPRKWQLVLRWLSPSHKFLYWQVGPLVRMTWEAPDGP